MKNIKHIRRFLYLAAAFFLTLAATGSTAVLAANDSDTVSGPAVIYTEATNAITFSGTAANNTDLFPNFKRLVPGDYVKQTITLVTARANADDCTFSMKAADNSDQAEFLDYLYLTVQKDGEVVASGQAAPGAGLTQWVELGTLAPGERMTVTVSLYVDKDMGNDFQNYKGKIRWMFRTVTADVPVVQPTTIPAEEQPQGGHEGGQEAVSELPEEATPLTGDTSSAWALINLLCAVAVFILCVILAIGYFVRKKKDGENIDEGTDPEAAADTYETAGGMKNGKKGGWRLASVVIAIIAVVLFFLTEDFRLPMIWTDKWTIPMAVILLAQIVDTVIVAYKKKDRSEGEEARR